MPVGAINNSPSVQLSPALITPLSQCTHDVYRVLHALLQPPPETIGRGGSLICRIRYHGSDLTQGALVPRVQPSHSSPFCKTESATHSPASVPSLAEREERNVASLSHTWRSCETCSCAPGLLPREAMAGEGITVDRVFPSAEFAPPPPLGFPPSLKFLDVGNNGRTDDSRRPSLRPPPQPHVLPSPAPHPAGFLRPMPNPLRSVIAASRSALAANHR